MSKPEITFKVGAVRASIFRNPIQHNGQTINIGKVVVEVRYRDKAGEWQGTHSLSANEIPKAMLALHKAYDHLMTHRNTDEPNTRNDSENTAGQGSTPTPANEVTDDASKPPVEKV